MIRGMTTGVVGMMKQNKRLMNASAAVVSAAGLVLGGCSQSQVAEVESKRAAGGTAVAGGTPTGHGGPVDAVAMEQAPIPGLSSTDPIVGNWENPPSSFAPSGSGMPGMALDVMESLAQVTFAKYGSDFDPSISRDGKTIVFSSTQHRPTADIYIKAVNGRTVTQLTADPAQDVMPSLSPDGARVAFASNRSGSWDIYIMSVTGGQAVQVTADSAQELHPSWSPDGSKLVYSRLGQVSGRWEMWVIDIEKPMSSEFIGYGLFPSWCPVAGTGDHGRDKIVFQRSRERGDRAFSVWTVDYKMGDASSPTEIASHQAAAFINPTWSPDGNWIVFASIPFVGEAPAAPATHRPARSDLWMCAVDGSGRVNLTTGRSVNLMPTWGADSRIYFISDRSGTENVWSIGTDKAMLAATGGRYAPGNTGQGIETTQTEAGAVTTEITTVPEAHGEKPSH